MSTAGAITSEAYSGCHSIKQLGIFRSCLVAIPLRNSSSLSNSSPVPISFSWVENGTVRVLCLDKKHNTQHNTTQHNIAFVIQRNTT